MTGLCGFWMKIGRGRGCNQWLRELCIMPYRMARDNTPIARGYVKYTIGVYLLPASVAADATMIAPEACCLN